MDKLIKRLLTLFLIFSTLPFLPEALNNIIQGTLAHIRFQVNDPWLGFSLRFVKDVLLVLILALLVVRDIKQMTDSGRTSRRLPFYFLLTLLVVYGISAMYLQTETINMLQIVSGIRTILIFVLCYKALEFFKDVAFIHKFSQTLSWLVTIELAVMLMQYYDFYQRYGLQNPVSLRILGTFGAFALAGYFALGAACFLLLYKVQFGRLLLLCCCMIAALSGTRSAIIGCVIIVCAAMLRGLKKGPRFNYLLISFASVGSMGVYFLVQAVSKLAERGSLVGAQVSGGRIRLFLDFFKQSSLSEILLGKGIGYGTNTAVNLNREYSTELKTQVMDGTVNTILTQYGLFVLMMAIILFAHLAIVLLKKNSEKTLETLTLLGVTLMMCITINILELYCFLFLLFVSYSNLLPIKNPQTSEFKMLDKRDVIAGQYVGMRGNGTTR